MRRKARLYLQRPLLAIPSPACWRPLRPTESRSRTTPRTGSALHPAAAARADAGPCRRGPDGGASRAIGGTRRAGRQRAHEALNEALMRLAPGSVAGRTGRSRSTPGRSAILTEEISPAPARADGRRVGERGAGGTRQARGPLKRWNGPCCPLDAGKAGRFRRTLAGAMITLSGGKLRSSGRPRAGPAQKPRKSSPKSSIHQAPVE